MKKLSIPFFIFSLGLLASCSQETKQSLGFVKNIPDEYRVVKHEKLSLPKDTQLPIPGKPMDIKRKKKVIKKTNALLLLKTNTKTKPIDDAEKAFLNDLNIHGNKDIYHQLTEDHEKARREEKQWQSKMKDTVLFWKHETKKKAKVINAEKEAERLKINKD